MAVDRPIQGEAEQEEAGDHNDERDEGIHSQRAKRPDAGVASKHQEFAVRDVKDLQHAEGQRQPECRDAVDTPDEEAVDQRLRQRRVAYVARSRPTAVKPR